MDANGKARLKVGWVSVVCLILLINLKRGLKCNHRGIAERFMRLSDSGMRFSDLGLRKAPGGFMSEDVLAWLWQLYPMGYYRGNPHADGLILIEEGKKFCEEVVAEETKRNPKEFRSVETALENDLSVDMA